MFFSVTTQRFKGVSYETSGFYSVDQVSTSHRSGLELESEFCHIPVYFAYYRGLPGRDCYEVYMLPRVYRKLFYRAP